MRSWLPFVVMTVLSWGTYIPTLHRGQLALGGSGVHAFLMVGTGLPARGDRRAGG